MASNLDYVFDPYVIDGFIDASYVFDPYVPDNYVSGIITGSADLSASFNLTAVGLRIHPGASTANANSTLAVDADVIRTGTTSSSGSFQVVSDADNIASGVSTLSSTNTITTSAVATLVGVSNISGALTATITGNATVSPGGDFVMSSAVSIDADRIAGGRATLNVGQDDIAWEEDISWDQPWDIIWGPSFEVGEISRIKRGVASVSAEFSVDVDGVITSVATLVCDSFASMDVSAETEIQGRASLVSNSTLSGFANTTSDINITLSSEASLTGRGIFVVLARPNDFEVNATTNFIGSKIVDSESTQNAQATLDAEPLRIRPGVAQFNASATLIANVDRVGSGTILAASSGELIVEGSRIVGGESIFASQASLFTNAGKLTGGIAVLNGFTAVLGVLTKYTIDPFRVFTIDSETRTIEILEETRIYQAKSQSRVNSIEQEMRIFVVPSETRALIVQPLALVEVEGDPLDRRTG